MGWGGSRPNTGGARKGAGRKKKESTLIRAKALEEAGEDAKRALGVILAFMEDQSLSPTLRRDCANDVMDRVWGKPIQKQHVTGAAGGAVVVKIITGASYDDL